MDKIVSLCRRRGFVFPSSEIYGGLGSSYDYGHYGVLLKENVKARWLEAMVRERDDIVALDSAIILHPQVWEASGHVAGFTDPLVDCRSASSASAPTISGDEPVRPQARASSPARTTRLRPHRGAPVQPDVRDPRRPGRGDRAARCSCGPRPRRGSSSTSRTSRSSRAASRRSGSRRSASRSATRSRPGTSSSARSSSSRWRWSSSCRPAEAEEWYRYWIDERLDWYTRYGIRPESLRVRAARGRRALALLERHERHRVPLSDRLVGARGDREPRRRSTSPRTRRRPGRRSSGSTAGAASGTSPRVIEPAAGVNRSMLAFLCDAYDEEVVGERERTVLRLHPADRAGEGRGAAARSPATRGMAEKARALYEELRRVDGRRARRQRPDRPPLPPPGRDRHAVGLSRSTSRRSSTTRSRSATATRSRRSGSRSAGRESTCSTGSRRPGAHPPRGRDAAGA